MRRTSDLVARALVLRELMLGRLARDAVALLDLADHLIALAGDLIPVAVGQLAPTFAGLADELLPVAFDLIPIHDASRGICLTERATVRRLPVFRELRARAAAPARAARRHASAAICRRAATTHAI